MTCACNEYVVCRWHAVEPCVWTETEEDAWDTQCGRLFSFIDGGPTENGMKFCCYCGDPLIEKRI